MKKPRHTIKELKVALFAVSIAMLCPGSGWACTACFGQSDSPLAAGMNWGIASLLGFIGMVLGAVAGFGLFLARRSARVNAQAEVQAMMEKVTTEEEGFEPAGWTSLEQNDRPGALKRQRPSCSRETSRRATASFQR